MGPSNFSIAGLKAGGVGSSGGAEEKKSQPNQGQGSIIHSSRPTYPMIGSAHSFQAAPAHPFPATEVATPHVINLDNLSQLQRHTLLEAVYEYGYDCIDNTMKLNQYIEGVTSKLKSSNQPSLASIAEALRSAIKKEMQEVQTEAVILKLVKTAEKVTCSRDEALNVVSDLPLVKAQATTMESFQRVAGQLCNNKSNSANLNISTELESLQYAKDGPQEGVLKFCDIDIETIRYNVSDLAAESNRMDKEETGLPNTIIVDQEDNLIALKNSVNLCDVREDVNLRTFLETKLRENPHSLAEKPHPHPQKNSHIKAILGQGSFGKVKLGQNIFSGKLLAVKKIGSIEYAQREVAVKDRLIQVLAGNHSANDIKYFLTVDSLSIDNKKLDNDGEEKAYVMSQLQHGDGQEAMIKIKSLKNTPYSGQANFQEAHGRFIIDTLDTLQALNRNNMIHADLKWDNIIGGKIADLDRLCYSIEDKMSALMKEYTPPGLRQTISRDGKIQRFHTSQESYDKHTSFTFGQMLLETIDLNPRQKFPLDRDGNGFVKRGYLETDAIPDDDSQGKAFSPYEKEVIRLAYALGDNDPKKRPSMEEAKNIMMEIYHKYTQ